MKPKICQISPKIYNLLTKIPDHRGIGGAELQAMLIASELVKRGYDVVTLTAKHDSGDLGPCDRLTLRPVLVRRSGRVQPGLLPRNMWRVARALAESEAGIYLLNAAGSMLAPMVYTAGKLGKKAIFWAASDSNFDPHSGNFRLSNARDGMLFSWGLRHCHGHIVQHRGQQESLRRHFGKSSEVIHNGLPAAGRYSRFRGTVLWVGSIRPVKNPAMFLEIARRLPDSRCVMIGGRAPGQHPLYEKTAALASQIPNLLFKGFCPYDEVEAYFDDASLLVSTSLLEGFPNTFLQAWSRGIPVISTIRVNPDGLLTGRRLGAVAATTEEIVEKIKAVLDGRLVFDRGEIRSFFERNLTIEKTVDGFERFMTGLLNTNGGGRA